VYSDLLPSPLAIALASGYKMRGEKPNVEIKMNIAQQLCQDFKLQSKQVINTLYLIEQGATVPFIARYRKEKTGDLDDARIRDLVTRFAYYKELEDRRETVLKSISAQGRLTAELENRIRRTGDKTELEDLYAPYKPKRATRAGRARQAGLEPFADWLYDLRQGKARITTEAEGFINREKKILSISDVIQGAQDILAERVADDAQNRGWLRRVMMKHGVLHSSVKKSSEAEKTKYQMYYNFQEKLVSLSSHRILAMFRGEREKILSLHVHYPQEDAIRHMQSLFIRYPDSASVPILKRAVKDGLERLLAPAIETEMRRQLKDLAEDEARKVFGENLKELLLAPPAGQKPVMGIDPGFRTGCKIAVCDRTGKFIEHQTIYPNEPHNDTIKASQVVFRMLDKHQVELIAIGNGTAGRESERFIRECLKVVNQEVRPVVVMVSEAGASVYSASEAARREFPDFDVTIRGAISIARRLQDPLSELVKIEPRSIGVGQYQHDVNQQKLKALLDAVVEKCVNTVGIDANLASEEILKHVSGLNRTSSRNLIDYRQKNGSYQSRRDFLKIPGWGAKTFEQAAGFLRIPGAVNPLDDSAVHPERYGFVEKLADRLGATVRELIAQPFLLRTVEKKELITNEIGIPTIQDIFMELEKPGRDPRESFKYAAFSEDIQTLSDLAPGMILEGVVTNVTNFGAFVDIGVHQDGLVHISELSDRYVDDPTKFIKVGQVVTVQVVKADLDLKRISLSIRALNRKQT